MVPEMTDEYVETVSARYIELFEHITGKRFEPYGGEDLLRDIEEKVLTFLHNS